MPPQLKFAYFGTPKVARDTLAMLSERGYVPEVVITAPDAPRGRGLVLTPSETRTFAEERGLPVLTPEKLDAGAIEEIGRFGCDFAICVAYGKIFPEELIAAFPRGVLNVHYSLLPKYRGATPLEAALLAGDTETGVTVQKMVKELDAGDILAQEAVTIGPAETAKELRPRLIALGARLLADILPKYLADVVTAVPQDHARATRARKLQKEDGLLSLGDAAETNWNKYRAFVDSIGTYFFTPDGNRVKIVTASFKNGEFVIERVIPEGKREMSYADFVRK
ncbi:methionyl-tRNA formyltransferase [Candidatus Kaiserbacteria bacterium]|nr:methionyl-tRNA formyltransferase [Candidatus Kaiserbacteria bacterium]